MSEPHRVSEPVQFALRDERGVVHNGWQNLGGAMRMGCSYYTYEWSDARDEPLTCVWCLAGYHPWLAWGPGAPGKQEI